MARLLLRHITLVCLALAAESRTIGTLRDVSFHISTMASRPRGHGLTAELQAKKDTKYDVELEKEARDWMEAVVEEPLSDGTLGAAGFHASLKDGVFLCKLANALGGAIKISTSRMAFKQMENIGNFLTFCQEYGVANIDLFQTVDLYEQQNMAQVVLGIHALGRQARKNGFDGPTLGPKEAQENVREFTEEQLREGEGVIGLQAGTNKVASQARMPFGAQH